MDNFHSNIKVAHVYVCSVMSNSLWPHGLQSTRLLCPWNFPGKNTRVGCVFLLLLGIFLTQESNPCLFPVLTGRFFTTELSGEPKKPLCSPKIMKNFKVQFYLLDTSDSEKSEWPDCMRNNWCADWSQKTGTIFQPGKNFQTSLMDFLFYYSLGFRSKKIVECQP